MRNELSKLSTFTQTILSLCLSLLLSLIINIALCGLISDKVQSEKCARKCSHVPIKCHRDITRQVPLFLVIVSLTVVAVLYP